MSLTLYWLQCGGCGGDTWSLFSKETPDLIELLASLDIEILWHPSISRNIGNAHEKLKQDLIAGHQKLDILCIEGAIIRGPRQFVFTRFVLQISLEFVMNIFF